MNNDLFLKITNEREDSHVPTTTSWAQPTMSDETSSASSSPDSPPLEKKRPTLEQLGMKYSCAPCLLHFRLYTQLLEHLFWKHGAESKQCAQCPFRRWPDAIHYCWVVPNQDRHMTYDDEHVVESDYCFCQKHIPDSKMVACKSQNCHLKWFHIGCVGLEELPAGEYYCPECIIAMDKPPLKIKLRRRSWAEQNIFECRAAATSPTKPPPKNSGRRHRAAKPMNQHAAAIQEPCATCDLPLPYTQKLEHLFWKHGTESYECPVCSQRRWHHADHHCWVLPNQNYHMLYSEAGLVESEYCFCRKHVPDSTMVACEGQRCKLQWFHLDCVGLKTPPVGDYYCPECVFSMNNNNIPVKPLEQDVKPLNVPRRKEQTKRQRKRKQKKIKPTLSSRTSRSSSSD